MKVKVNLFKDNNQEILEVINYENYDVFYILNVYKEISFPHKKYFAKWNEAGQMLYDIEKNN